MSTIESDLKSFTQFVLQQSRDEPELTLTELFDLWLLQNPTEEDYAENVAAINASINDFLRGERGTRAGVHSRQLRREFRINEQ